MKIFLFTLGAMFITWCALTDGYPAVPQRQISQIKELPAGVPLVMEVRKKDSAYKPEIGIFDLSTNSESVWDLPPEVLKNLLKGAAWASQSHQLMLAYDDAIFQVNEGREYWTVNLEILANMSGPYDNMRNYALSPDGKSVAYSLYGKNRQTNKSYKDLIVQQGQGKPWTLSKPGYDFQSDWSPDGKKIAFNTYDNVLIVKDLNAAIQFSILAPGTKDMTGEMHRRLTNATGVDEAGPASIRTIRWSPEGNKLAFLADFRLYLVDLDNGTQPVPVFKENNKISVRSFAWSPDGKQIAFRSSFEAGEACTFNPRFFFDMGHMPCRTKDYLYTVAIDGSNLKPISKIPEYNSGVLFWIR